MNVLIYSKDKCSYCVEAKRLLTENNMPYIELDVSRPDVLDQLLELIPKVKTVPQIFIDGTHIGGYTELVDYLK